MTAKTPPRSLPAALAPLWTRLRDADEASASRQDLARLLGISTATLQRLLVSGDLPDFGRGANTRETHALVRTFTRLAVYFGEEPRRWIEAAGVEWEERIAAISGAAMTQSRNRGRARSRRTSRKGAATWPDPSATGPAIQLGVASMPVLGAPLPSLGRSFLEEYARRWFGSVQPDITIEAHAWNGLHAGGAFTPGASAPRLHAISGVIATPRDVAAGGTLIEIPGFLYRLAAIVARRESHRSRAVSWDDIYHPSRLPSFRAAVVRGSPAETFLVVHCGWPANRTVRLDVHDAAEAAHAARHALDRSDGPLLMVGDQGFPARLTPVLEAEAILPAPLLHPELAPRYPIAVALSAPAGEWPGRLREARDQELFGSAVRATAHLYALVIASSAFGGAGVTPLEAFPEATAEFVDAFSRHFAHVLVSAPPVIAHSGATLDLSPVAARRAALTRAAELIPAAWRPSFSRALGDAVPGEMSLCQSCSASLPHHRGASDHFCRFCSDERGVLRPRAEVEAILAGWLRHWEQALTSEDARVAASRFMSAMPAWSRN